MTHMQRGGKKRKGIRNLILSSIRAICKIQPLANISKTVGTVVREGYRKVQERLTINIDLQRYVVGPDHSKIHFCNVILYQPP